MLNGLSRFHIVLGLVFPFFTGCALIPYNNEFACQGDVDYGKCTNVSGAYNEAVTGEAAGPTMRKDKSSDQRNDQRKDQTDPFADNDDEFLPIEEAVTPAIEVPAEKDDPYLDYKNAVYKKMTHLITESANAPMLKHPTQVRTLILPYPSNSNTKALYMSRYVYYMIDSYEWVLGDYLSVIKKERQLSEIYQTE